jgi:RND family efflux transporter MFP subunit
MRRHLPGITAATALALLALPLGGCGPRHGKTAEPAAGLPTAQVRVQIAESKTRTMTEEVVGTVRAKLRATMEAKLNGRIDRMPVALGDRVQKGQLLAQLDAAELAARLEQAEAALAQAESDWKRAATLFEQQSVTRAEYDSAQARQRMARAAVSEIKAMLANAQIVAPFDGVVTRKWADVGDLAAPGKPLVDLDDPAVLQLEADVPETVTSQIQRGSQWAVRVDALRSVVTGTVSELAPAADPLSRTCRVKLDLPQTAGLMPGQFARLAVPIGEGQALRVPAMAVLQRGQLEMLFVAADQHAHLHLVRTGRRVGDEVEILSGLEAGCSVIVSGAELLTDGQPVEAR